MDIELAGSSLSFQPTAHVSPVARGKSPGKLMTWPPLNSPEPDPSCSDKADMQQ